MTDTAAALASLQIVKGYYDRLCDQKLTYSEQLDCIKFAAHHLTKARAADPTAALKIDTPKGTETWTQEVLSASILYIQASLEAAHDDKLNCEKALETLKQASAYGPNMPYIHRKIAEVLLKLHRRSEALTAAKFALALNPNDMQSRILVDKIDTTPELGVPEPPPPGAQATANGEMISAFGALLLFGAPFVFHYIGHNDLIFGSIVFGILFMVAGFKISDLGRKKTLIYNSLRKDHYQ